MFLAGYIFGLATFGFYLLGMMFWEAHQMKKRKTNSFPSDQSRD